MDPPIYNHDKSLSCIRKALALYPNNPKALLILAFLFSLIPANIDETLLAKLQSMQTNLNEMDSMLRYAASWLYFCIHNRKKQKELLKESISIYDGHVWNYIDLSRIYRAHKRKDTARRLITRAFQNIKTIYRFESKYDPTNVEKFLNERIKGIILMDRNYESIKKRHCLN